MELTKNELKSIRAYDNNFDINKIHSTEDARGQEIQDIIVFSLGRKSMHDSGYPYFRMIGRQYTQGVKSGIKYFDLGCHDHFLCNIKVNIDSYGKNLFRVMPWMGGKSFQVSPHCISCGTFSIGNIYPNIGPNNTLN